jgi:hypothetical protein
MFRTMPEDRNADDDNDASQCVGEIEAIVAGARYQLSRLEERAEILAPVLQVTDRFDSVYALVRSSESPEALWPDTLSCLASAKPLPGQWPTCSCEASRRFVSG